MLLYILVLQARPQIQNKVHQIPQKLEWKLKHVLYPYDHQNFVEIENALFFIVKSYHQQRHHGMFIVVRNKYQSNRFE